MAGKEYSVETQQIVNSGYFLNHLGVELFGRGGKATMDGLLC